MTETSPASFASAADDTLERRVSTVRRVLPHVATEKEYWPIDSLRSFHPGNTYVFNIAVKGNDEAETASYSVELNWTGNWATSEMRAISPP